MSSSFERDYCAKYLVSVGNLYENHKHTKAKTEGETEVMSRSILHSLFLIVASDGLWDVMSNVEATELVCELLLTHIVKVQISGENMSDAFVSLLPEAMQAAAKLLALEAFVRGSMDNVGVCVVDLTASAESSV